MLTSSGRPGVTPSQPSELAPGGKGCPEGLFEILQGSVESMRRSRSEPDSLEFGYLAARLGDQAEEICKGFRRAVAKAHAGVCTQAGCQHIFKPHATNDLKFHQKSVAPQGSRRCRQNDSAETLTVFR